MKKILVALLMAIVVVIGLGSPAVAKKPVPANYVPAVSVQNVVESYSVRDEETGNVYVYKRSVITVYYGANTTAQITEPDGTVVALASGARYLPQSVNYNYKVEFFASGGYVFRADQAAVEGLTLDTPSHAFKYEWVPFLV